MMNEACEYAVLIDRISHEIPYYRTYLKNAMLQGTYCVNNPFQWSADDKFFGASLITKMGIPSPRTVALPSREYIPGIVTESLRNLVFPLDWEALVAKVGGFPAILKDAWGGGWKNVYVVRSMQELWDAYNETGTLCMILQEFIEFEQFVRCVCVGQTNIMPIRYDPKQRRYHVDHAHLSPELGAQVVDYAKQICTVCGYDMNSIEFAIKDGVPYAIDFTNPAPDADIWSVTEPYHNWIVEKMATLLVDYAKNGQPTAHYHRWYKWLNPEVASTAAATAGQVAQTLVAGVEQIAHTASNVLSEVIDQITEPIKPKRARKPAEKETKAAPKAAKSVKATKTTKK